MNHMAHAREVCFASFHLQAVNQTENKNENQLNLLKNRINTRIMIN